MVGSIVKAIGSIAVGCIGFAFYSHFFAGPPVHLLSITEQDGVAIRGGRIELLVKRAPNSRICETHTDRNLWRWEVRDGERIRIIVPLPLRSSVIVPTKTEQVYIVSMEVPSSIRDGQWFYTARSSYMCPWIPGLWGNEVTQTPDVPVMIKNPTASDPPMVVTSPGPTTIIQAPPDTPK